MLTLYKNVVSKGILVPDEYAQFHQFVTFKTIYVIVISKYN